MSGIISLTGDLGSGKSTVSAILCKQLNYDYIYTGQIQRRIAERYAMTTNELNVYAETHPEIDSEIDETFKSLAEADRLIVDSRLAWFFVPASFKVFLKTNIVVSARRISGDRSRINENYASIQEAALKIVERKKSEVKRYKQYYGVDCLDLTNYDLIIDTTEILPDEVCDIILREFDLFSRRNERHYDKRAFVSPRNLYPTLPTDDCRRVTVAYRDAFDYIVSGHRAVADSLRAGDKLIEVSYVPSSDTLPLPDTALLRQWQREGGFEYLIEP